LTNPKTHEPLEVCWRVVEGSTTRILMCGIVGASTHGVELRVGYFINDPLHSQAMRDMESARLLAEHWLDSVRGVVVSP
jgi:hypothetical protein